MLTKLPMAGNALSTPPTPSESGGMVASPCSSAVKEGSPQATSSKRAPVSRMRVLRMSPLYLGYRGGGEWGAGAYRCILGYGPHPAPTRPHPRGTPPLLGRD